MVYLLMPERLDLLQLRSHFRSGDDLIALHYGCENLYAATDHPASISCIAFSRIGRADSDSFSVIDVPKGTEPADAELGLLTAYFNFMQQRAGVAFVHWNMSKPDYGFGALEARYKFLTGNDPPYRVPRDRAFDLDDLISHEFGRDYAPHPRLIGVSALNGLSRHHALSGEEEAERFDAGDHGAIRRSIAEKAHWVAVLAELFLTGQLKTVRTVGSIRFAGTHLEAVQVVIEVGRRFLYVQRELSRRHDDRPTLEVSDEYDEQDLFRSMLRLFFDDIRPEDHTPVYAGGSSRIDFVLPEFELAVELKYARDSMTAKTLGDELIIDVARYGDRSDVRHLICLVFDHDGILRNPRGLETDLARETTGGGIAVNLVILDR